MFAWGGGQLRILDNFNLGPSLVRGFSPGGLGPRDITNTSNLVGAGLGGTNFIGGTLEAQFPIFGLPKEIGLKGAVFTDAGTLFGYKGRTYYPELSSQGGWANGTCTAVANQQANCMIVRDSHQIRSSAGVSLLWASPLGPIRFDFAKAITKDQYDQTQFFRFTGGSSF